MNDDCAVRVTGTLCSSPNESTKTSSPSAIIPGVNNPSGTMLSTTSGHAGNSPDVETVEIRESAPSTAIEYVRESSPKQDVVSLT